MPKVANVFLRSTYNYDRDDVSRETGVLCEDESLTLQSEAEDADINTIVKRFGLTGQLPDNVRAPTYGDFTDVSDFRTAMDAVVAARESFDAMPAHVRARFHNDPAEFVDFCSDPENLQEMVKLGLAIPKPKEDDTPTPDGPGKEKGNGNRDGVKSGAGKGDASGGKPDADSSGK